MRGRNNNQLPTNWSLPKLKEVAKLSGRIGWKGLTAKEYTEFGPLFLSVHSLNYGDYVDFRNAFHISQHRYDESPEIMLQPDDILICKDGAGIGKAGIIGELPGPASINSSMLLIRAGSLVKPKYLYYALLSPYFQSIVQSRLEGATTPHLYQRDIKEFPVHLPPIDEQKRIVAILDEAFSGITQAVTNAERNLANSRELFESFLNSIFTQKGEGWVEKSIGDLAKLARGQNPPKSQFVYEPKDGYVRFYQIRDGKTDIYTVYVPDTPQLHRVEPDDILMVAYRHIGRVFRGASGAFNVALCKITNKDRHVLLDDYLFHIIPSNHVRGELLRRSERSLIPSMSVKHFKNIRIPVPPFSVQKRIVGQLNVLKAKTQHLETIYQQKLTALAELKQSILQKAFTGELTTDATYKQVVNG